jgi:hypothetical protein
LTRLGFRFDRRLEPGRLVLLIRGQRTAYSARTLQLSWRGPINRESQRSRFRKSPPGDPNLCSSYSRDRRLGPNSCGHAYV